MLLGSLRIGYFPVAPFIFVIGNPQNHPATSVHEHAGRNPSALLLAAGASDDAVSCAVMLGVLHSLANQSAPLHHGVIFLFNGAEENVLQVNRLPR